MPRTPAAAVAPRPASTVLRFMAFLPCMPVPCKRDFGLAVDAATTAKRMQNGAAVEANCKQYPKANRPQTAEPMIAIILANPSPEARDRTSPVPQFAASARHGLPAYPLPRQRVCDFT